MGRDIVQTVAAMQGADEAFVVAMVVRTVSDTAAKAEANAVIRTDGVITEGRIGDGCARGAVLKAAREALADGQPRLISVSPEDVMNANGVAAGHVRVGVQSARNMCPSKGTMDIFIEPVIPRSEMIVCGASPMALALVALGTQFEFSVLGSAAANDLGADPESVKTAADLATPPSNAERFIVVASQARGDEAALRAALDTPATNRAFIGSRAKTAALSAKLSEVATDVQPVLHVPAGLNLETITPDEISLSILAHMVAHRRQGQRKSADAPRSNGSGPGCPSAERMRQHPRIGPACWPRSDFPAFRNA